ncbi:MAG: bifunctional folylpolyglutamate synthase/dihydrofolate synthase [Gemmataceae bacterium]
MSKPPFPLPCLTYEQALAFWYGRINYEQRSPQPGDLKLDRMRALLELLGNPHHDAPIVHVAGSKGKGSTAAMLAAIVRRAGLRTGLFTSPHLSQVEERIQIDDQPITPDELAVLMTEVKAAVEILDARLEPAEAGPTFFEIVTALGFLSFARQRVDLAVLEVGLGGRFDSTNVCHPLVAVITSISHDHTHLLGERLAQIAYEKAGIIKAGRPVVSGATVAEARQVIEEVSRERGAPLWQLGRDVHYEYRPGLVTSEQERHACVRIRAGHHDWPWMELGLLGEHQAANAALAVAVVEHLRAERIDIPDQAVRDGLAQVRWPARMEVVSRRPLVVLDCAHNVASVQALVETLRQSFPGGRRLLILAVSNDKDITGMLRVLAPSFDHAYLTRYLNNPRCLPPEQMVERLRADAALPCTVCPMPADAWHAARAAAAPDDLICVTGSVFLAGEMRQLLLGEQCGGIV